jgi:hypothetical protein
MTFNHAEGAGLSAAVRKPLFLGGLPSSSLQVRTRNWVEVCWSKFNTPNSNRAVQKPSSYPGDNTVRLHCLSFQTYLATLGNARAQVVEVANEVQRTGVPTF